nr:hypothetical protein [Tanacetum cinerariifolium]
MIAYLSKSNASEGFNQIIDFLNGSSITYALTINPNIYVSCIKQFWTSVAVKKVNDVMRLQALVDNKKVIITEATIRDALHLDDAEGIECLPNEEIFVELARMGSDKPLTKFTFYKAFELMPSFNSILRASASLGNDLGRKFNFSKYIFDSLVRNVDSPTKFYMYPRFLQLMIWKQVGDLSIHTTKYSSPALTQKVFANMRMVGKGFSRVETPLFERMIVEQQVDEDADEVNVDDVPAIGVAAEGVVGAANDEVPTAVEEPSIPSPTPPTPPPQPSQDQHSTSQGRMIVDIDVDVDVTLEDAKEVAAKKYAEVDKSADIQGRKAESQEQIYQINLEHANKVATITAATPQLTTVAAPTLTTAPSAARKRKGVVIRDPEESASPSTIVHSEAKSKDRDWDEVIDHVQRKQKKDNAVKRYQALKRKPQTEAQARKNMMIYLRNVAGFKMDYFKGMNYNDIRPIFEKHFNSNVAFPLKTKEHMDKEDNRALKRLSESQEDKAAKKHKLDEEVEELRRHLQIVPNDEDDVYTEATPLARKIITFTTTRLILLVERRYPLTRFTLDQMVNNVRLEVEEESEVSLELLREGFNQIIDFLNGSSIKYALTVNPNIYVSCIKQFWTPVAVKKFNDVMRLQALVDKKKVIITEATIRDALFLDDVEGIECLPNEEIFAELARIGYEKHSAKLTFYNAFFLSQWKFLIHTILQCISAKRTSWNEFSSSMASVVICLSTGKGFSGVETPLFEGMIVEQKVDEDADEVNVDDVPAIGVAAEGVVSAANDKVPTAIEEPSILSPTLPT